MAKIKSTIYLGFEDEEITGKHVACLNSAVNKVGGVPDWPYKGIQISACPICGAMRPLIVQIYAPLEYSPYHRTLYVFACLSPLCSQNSNSWLCVRTQYLDIPGYSTESTSNFIKTHIDNSLSCADNGDAGGVNSTARRKKNAHKTTTTNVSWCKGIDDWGDNKIERMDTRSDDYDNAADDIKKASEENGNIMKNRNINMVLDLNEDVRRHCSVLEINEEDDEDDSNSMENDVTIDFNKIQVSPSQQIAEDPNANCAAAALAAGVSTEEGCKNAFSGDGAIAVICAEIEGSETDVVHVETPKKPERDLLAILKQSNALKSIERLAKMSDITLKSFFIAVEVETQSQSKDNDYYGSGALSIEHIRELYQEYKRQDEINTNSPNGKCVSHQLVAGSSDDQERYEKMLPPHGDIMFHNFISTLRKNPGQILRYSRDSLPLLLAPLKDDVPKCPNCNAETICEVQLLSTLIPKLKIRQTGESAPIEYGTILIFTCLRSCWDIPDTMRYERVIVQTETYSPSDHCTRIQY